MCVDQTYRNDGNNEGAYAGCAFMFKVGEAIFNVDVGSESDRGAGTIRYVIDK